MQRKRHDQNVTAQALENARPRHVRISDIHAWCTNCKWGSRSSTCREAADAHARTTGHHVVINTQLHLHFDDS